MSAQVAAFLLIVGLEQASPALEASIQAAYKQTGLEQSVTEYTQGLERKYLNESSKAILGNLLILTKTLSEKRVSFQISF